LIETYLMLPQNYQTEIGVQRKLVLAVVIPCYRVKSKIISVLASIPTIIDNIYVIDDFCPENSGDYVKQHCQDPRVQVLFNSSNLGVGGAVKTGYRKAIEEQADIVVKIDGDGQMDPGLIDFFVRPIIRGEADYCKGNRFFNLDSLTAMPTVRLLGNAGLSFINKAVSGYWNLMDPTNGYTAISRYCLERLPLDKIENRYFFESDMLFRLGTLRACIRDIPMDAIYADEQSSLNVKKVLFRFPLKFLNRFFKRIFYIYFLRDFSVASICLILGTILSSLGLGLGIYSWSKNALAGTFASTGTVMLASLPILVGIQLLLIALVLDIMSVPKHSLTRF
jgi:dolichol-phosphate mannosyltransferase